MSAVLENQEAFQLRRVPASSTALLGRDRDLDEIIKLLSDDTTRLLSLLGPGGAGKTRLALGAGERIEHANPGIVTFVSASALSTSEELVGAIAGALELRDETGFSLEQTLVASLRAEGQLLILDNLEQIPDAGRVIGRLLAECPLLTVLATSRIALRLRGERRFQVEPLPVESSDGTSISPAVQLFCDRARDLNPSFELTEGNRETVVEICRRLDGLPLAIELAAARTRSLSPAALLARVSNQLTVLFSNSADLPERHRTMQAAIAWSYDLLPPPAQRALRRLSVIPAGFDLDLASTVCAESSKASLALIEELLDQSLLLQETNAGHEPRFRMLQTIREFALEIAHQSGEVNPVEQAIAKQVVERSGAIRQGITGKDALTWREYCNREHATIQLALGELTRERDAVNAIQLAGSLWRYWYGAGRYREGIDALTTALSHPGNVTVAERANACNGLGALHYAIGNQSGAISAWDEALHLWKEAGDRYGEASTINNRSLVAREQGEYRLAIELLERAVSILESIGETNRLAATQDNLGLVLNQIGETARAIELHAMALATSRVAEDEAMVAAASHHLGSCLLEQGKWADAEQLVETSAEIWQRHGDLVQLGYALNTLGNIYAKTARRAEADSKYDDAMRVWRERGYSRGVSLALLNLGVGAEQRGDFARALACYRESLDLRRQAGEPLDLAFSLSSFASLAMATGDPERSARLLGVSEQLRRGAGLPGVDESSTLELRALLGQGRFEKYWTIGLSMPLGDAFIETELVTSRPDERKPETRQPILSPLQPCDPVDHGLTARELDVLRLVATGKTNAEIGEALFISPFTAKTHVANLLGKLAVENRAAASTWAAQHALL